MGKDLIGSLMIRFEADTGPMMRQTAELQRTFDRTARQMEAQGQRVLGFAQRHERAMTRAGMASVAFGTATAFALRKAGDAATELNSRMANVGTLIPGQTQRVLELRDGVQDLAVEVGKSTHDIAEGLYQVVSAFSDTADTAAILEINAKGATAGMAQTSEAIALTSAVTKGYGDTTAQAVQHATDLAFTTVRLGQTDFPQLAAAIGSVVPLAAALNVTQEELFGTMATFTGVTGNAGEVATQLQSALTALMNPSAELQGLMDQLGFATGEAMISGLGLQGTIQAIADEADASETPIMSFLRRKEAVVLALAASGGQAGAFSEKLAEMQDVAGATDAAMREITDGVNAAGFTAAQASAAWQVATEKLGESVAPVWGRIAVGVHGAADAFSNLSPRAQQATATAGMTAAALGILGGAALIALPKLARLNVALAATGPLGLAASRGISMATGALLGPWGIAAATATTAGLSLARAFREGRDSAAELRQEIIDTSSSVEEANRRMGQSLDEHMDSWTDSEATWSSVRNAIMGPVGAFFQLRDGIHHGTTAWELWRGEITATELDVHGLRDALALQAADLGNVLNATTDAAGGVEMLGAEMGETAGATEEATSAFDDLAPSVTAAFMAYAAGFDPLPTYQEPTP